MHGYDLTDVLYTTETNHPPPAAFPVHILSLDALLRVPPETGASSKIQTRNSDGDGDGDRDGSSASDVSSAGGFNSKPSSDDDALLDAVIAHLTGLLLKSGREGYVLVVLAATDTRGKGKGKGKVKVKAKGNGNGNVNGKGQGKGGRSRSSSRDEASDRDVRGVMSEEDEEEEGKLKGKGKESVQRDLPGLGWIVWNWRRIPRGLRKGIKRLVSVFSKGPQD